MAMPDKQETRPQLVADVLEAEASLAFWDRAGQGEIVQRERQRQQQRQQLARLLLALADAEWAREEAAAALAAAPLPEHV